MSGRYKKLGLKDIRYSGKYILASVIVEGLLLAPKTTITWQGKEVQVGGVIPMLQKEIAASVRNGVNTVLPKAAVTVENAFRQTPIKDVVIEKTLWFVYDFMSDVTLNSLVTTVLERAGLSDTIKLEGLFRDRLQAVIDSKDDREKLIAGLSDFLINTANTVFAGTSVSAFLNGGLGDNVKATVADYIDKGLDTELGGTVVSRVLDAVEQFETLTLAGFLERYFDLPRPAFEKFLSDTYEKYLGTQMVADMSNTGIGDELYSKIAGMDYDRVFQDITKNHWRELVQVTMSAAGVGMYFLNQSRKAEAKQEKKTEKKARKAYKKSNKKAAKANARAAKKAKKKK
ncbi:MAG: hypothetical protein IJ241_09240 [Clostridia bacterium]|nr:hypothetical protein [Clostridia bacterium]MBQ8925549.1 hypothetical protein [Clostridia bacterium]